MKVIQYLFVITLFVCAFSFDWSSDESLSETDSDTVSWSEDDNADEESEDDDSDSTDNVEDEEEDFATRRIRGRIVETVWEGRSDNVKKSFALISSKGPVVLAVSKHLREIETGDWVVVRGTYKRGSPPRFTQVKSVEKIDAEYDSDDSESDEDSEADADSAAVFDYPWFRRFWRKVSCSKDKKIKPGDRGYRRCAQEITPIPRGGSEATPPPTPDTPSSDSRSNRDEGRRDDTPILPTPTARPTPTPSLARNAPKFTHPSVVPAGRKMYVGIAKLRFTDTNYYSKWDDGSQRADEMMYSEKVEASSSMIARGNLRDLFRECSYGQVDFKGTYIGEVNLNERAGTSGNDCDNSLWEWETKAVKAIEKKQGNSFLDQFDAMVYVIPHFDSWKCQWAGVASCSTWGRPRAASTVVRFNAKVFDVAHELGHLMGLQHATNDVDFDGRADGGNDYADGSSLMSNKRSPVNGPHRHQLGWIPKSAIVNVDASALSSQEVTLKPLDIAPNNDDVVLVKILLPGITSAGRLRRRYIFAEFRRRVTDTTKYESQMPAECQNAVVIRSMDMPVVTEPGDSVLGAYSKTFWHKCLKDGQSWTSRVEAMDGSTPRVTIRVRSMSSSRAEIAISG